MLWLLCISALSFFTSVSNLNITPTQCSILCRDCSVNLPSASSHLSLTCKQHQHNTVFYHLCVDCSINLPSPSPCLTWKQHKTHYTILCVGCSLKSTFTISISVYLNTIQTQYSISCVKSSASLLSPYSCQSDLTMIQQNTVFWLVADLQVCLRLLNSSLWPKCNTTVNTTQQRYSIQPSHSSANCLQLLHVCF